MLHVLVNPGDCKRLHPCTIATDAIATTCTYHCPCEDAATSCDIILSNVNLYKPSRVPNLCKVELVDPSTVP